MTKLNRTVQPNEIDGQTYEQCKQHLLTTYNTLCPNGAVQAKLSRTITSLEADGMSNHGKLRMLTSWLYDGLAYGNWLEGGKS